MRALRSVTLSGLVLCAVSLLYSGDAYAFDIITHQSGFGCVRNDSSPGTLGSDLAYSAVNGQPGVFNRSATDQLWLYCPITWTQQSEEGSTLDISQVDVVYKDRTSSDSVSCLVEGLSSTDTVYVSAATYSCATSGGCSNDTSHSFTSDYYTFYYLSVPGITTGYIVNAFVSCSVPAAPSYLYSEILSYDTWYDAGV